MELALTLGITLVTLLITAAVSVLALVVPLGLMAFFVWQMTRPGAVLVVSSPLVDVLNAAAAANAPRPAAKGRVKVGRCPSCGAGRMRPSASAYVHCDHCGQLMDWDFRAAMTDRRSRAPGPAYEALLARCKAPLQRAREAGDQDAYRDVQAELWEAYARLCPAACPPRIGDPAYRERWIAWSARSSTLQDLDPACQETFAAQQGATGALRWDRSNPFQPRAELTTYRALLEAVIAHQERVIDRLDASRILADHPDRPPREILARIGVAAFVQGWLPYIPASEHDATLDRAGLSGEYVTPEPVDLTSGTCPCCSATLEVVPDARRVVCGSCGHTVTVGGGTLPCHGCGVSIDIPSGPGAPDAWSCPHCDLRMERLRT